MLLGQVFSPEGIHRHKQRQMNGVRIDNAAAQVTSVIFILQIVSVFINTYSARQK